MEIKNIINHATFGVLIEGIGFIVALSIIGYVIFGGGLGSIAEIFAESLCG